MTYLQLSDNRKTWYVSTTVCIILMQLLLCCYKPKQPEHVEENIAPAQGLDSVASVEKGEGSVQAEKERTQQREQLTVIIAEEVARELKMTAVAYEIRFERSIPSCVECSNLERLLVLERVYEKTDDYHWGGKSREKTAPYVDVSYVAKDTSLENKLIDAGAEYCERFGKQLPWWWVCSDKEKLERIKLSFKTNTPYPEYSGERGEIDYRLGKAIAGYEMLFKRLPPKQDCSDEKWHARLKHAIMAGSPFLTDGEEAALKAAYVKKFKKPITDFESLVVKVSLSRRVSGYDRPQTSVTRTPTGAIALYQPSTEGNDIVSVNPSSIELQLRLDEWLDFVHVVHGYVGNWAETDCESLGGEYLSDDYWELKLFYANTDQVMPPPSILRPFDKCPIDWNGLVKFMNAMETKAKNNGVKTRSKKTSVGQNQAHFKENVSARPKTLKIAKNPISAGDRFIAGVKLDGTVITAVGPLFHGFVELISGLNRWKNIVAVSVGDLHVVGLRSDGTVVSAGVNSGNRCSVANWKSIVAVSAGSHHTLGLSSTGTVVAMGLNSDGQCDVANWNNIVAISAGKFHTLGLRSDGTVVSAGSNSNGQCDVGDWKEIVAISAGRFHSVGLKSNGTVVAVGWDWDGMCSKTLWWDNIIALAAGDFHTVGLRSNGTVLAVGDNTNGHCNVSSWKNIVAIAASRYHTIGLKSNGTAMAVGTAYLEVAQADTVSSWRGLDVVGVVGSK